jgi:hypothetical protein
MLSRDNICVCVCVCVMINEILMVIYKWISKTPFYHLKLFWNHFRESPSIWNILIFFICHVDNFLLHSNLMILTFMKSTLYGCLGVHELWSTNLTDCMIHWSKFHNYLLEQCIRTGGQLLVKVSQLPTFGFCAPSLSSLQVVERILRWFSCVQGYKLIFVRAHL